VDIFGFASTESGARLKGNTAMAKTTLDTALDIHAAHGSAGCFETVEKSKT
jgi:hypothetical protein